jgi:hypothetical protein
MIKNYEILDDSTPDGFKYVKLTSGDHEGIIYSYGAVNLVEEDEQVRLKFEYNIHDYAERELKDNFINEIGDVLQNIMLEQLSKNEVVYKGGVDENRTKDSSESDI